MTRLIAFALSLAYTGLGYGLIAWKYQNFSRLGPRGRRVLVALHLWFVFSNVALFAGWVIHDYRPGSWHPLPLAGFGLFAAGAALVVWALAHIRSAAFVSSAERPLTEGPYARVRHPVYAGGILSAFGLAYAAGSIWIFSYAVAHEVTRRLEYLDAAKRVLATLGGEVKTLLLDEPDTTPAKKIAEAVFYLRAYGQVVQPPQKKPGDR